MAGVTLPVTRPCPIPSPACVMLLHCLVTRQVVNTEAFGHGVGSAHDREREAAYRLRKQVRGSCLPAASKVGCSCYGYADTMSKRSNLLSCKLLII